MNMVDAVVTMEGTGPIKGRPRWLNLIMASTEGPTLERVPAEITGIKLTRLRLLGAARELGIGVPRLDRSEVAAIGTTMASGLTMSPVGRHPGRNYVIRSRWSRWTWPS